MSQILSVTPDAILKAAEILRSGGLVGMPTETVYGLAANALDGRAVAKIFEAKGRPQFNPLIVHVMDITQVEELAEVGQQARELAAAFWPGPLTMILPRRGDSGLSDLVSAGLSSVAVRVPAHKDAQALLKACGFPLAAPSANKSGSLSPTTPKHVVDSLGATVDLILAAGPCKVGLESTVVDLSTGAPVVLRPGGICAEDLSRVLGCDVSYDVGDGEMIKSPGQLLKHYAPGVPVRLNAIDLFPGEALLGFGSLKFMGVRGGGGAAADLPDTQVKNLSESGDLYEAAAHLFSMLHDLDRPEHKGIAVMAVPETGVGVAINDRLRRAARG